MGCTRNCPAQLTYLLVRQCIYSIHSVRVRMLGSSVMSPWLCKDAASKPKARPSIAFVVSPPSFLSQMAAMPQRSAALYYPLPLGPQQHQQLMYANMSVSEGGKEGGREGGRHSHEIPPRPGRTLRPSSLSTTKTAEPTWRH